MQQHCDLVQYLKRNKMHQVLWLRVNSVSSGSHDIFLVGYHLKSIILNCQNDNLLVKLCDNYSYFTAEQTNKNKTTVYGIMAHEFKNKLLCQNSNKITIKYQSLILIWMKSAIQSITTRLINIKTKRIYTVMLILFTCIWHLSWGTSCFRLGNSVLTDWASCQMLMAKVWLIM